MRGVMRLAAAAAGLLALVLAAGALFLARPGVFLTDRTAAAALKHFGADWSPRWSRLGLSAAALEWRRHRYVLSAADFCADERRGAFSACFSELELSMVVRYSRRGPILETVERVVAVAEHARLDLRRFQPRKGGALKSRTFPSVGAVHVELPRFEFHSSKTSVFGGLRAVLTRGQRPLFLSVEALIRAAGSSRRLKASLIADTDLLK